jgi:short-subunit dehydrogenase
MNKKVLITGGSSGIGYGLSRHFAAAGYDLFWVSLSLDELNVSKEKLLRQFKNTTIHVLEKNLSDDNAALSVYKWTQSFGPIDVLVNNAGLGVYGMVKDTKEEEELEMIKCNVLSTYQLTKLYLPKMIASNDATIINISSNSSFQPVPRLCTYAATKAFISHFSRGLAEEMKMSGSNVKVITVCPSAVRDTAFKERSHMEGVKTFSGLAFTTAEEVAKDIWNAFRKGKEFVVTGRKMRFLYLFHHLIPYRITQYITQKETERASV